MIITRKDIGTKKKEELKQESALTEEEKEENRKLSEVINPLIERTFGQEKK